MREMCARFFLFLNQTTESKNLGQIAHLLYHIQHFWFLLHCYFLLFCTQVTRKIKNQHTSKEELYNSDEGLEQ